MNDKHGLPNATNELKVTIGFRCREKGQTLVAFKPVPDKPGFWSVKRSVIAYGFRSHGSKPIPPIEMHEDELIEIHLKEEANNAALQLNTIGFSPGARIRKSRDNKPFIKGGQIQRQRVKPNRKHLIHAILMRIQTQSPA